MGDTVAMVKVLSGNGREVTYGRWGVGPRWHATLRHGYLRQGLHWFESESDAEAWAQAVVSAPPPETLWLVADRGKGNAEA